ncbi:hypothetical protein Tsubulata_017175 [Turnera subulata]|uniref:Uncharacterized protein n=1 Tax=Turnera subulata TaxID=218843 RepID=A0A9Q0JPL5_9ROSI|nr:hypothetical protein Tsubulata_017175 [Turnera subulata]
MRGQSKLNSFTAVNKGKHNDIRITLSEVPVLRNQTLQSELNNGNSRVPDTVKSLQGDHHQTDDAAEVGAVEPSKYRRTGLYDTAQEIEIEKSKSQRADVIFNKLERSLSSTGTSEDEEFREEYASTEVKAPPPNDASSVTHGKGLEEIDEDLKARRLLRLSKFSSCSSSGMKKSHRIYTAATLELPQLDNEEQKARALAAATAELERLFRKEYFARMKVVMFVDFGLCTCTRQS